ANVMLEYELQEAKELLETKLSTAQNTLNYVVEDLEFMREQITTME
ncbi:3295_t:CDS:1, partial [Dentiscutata heterogama]